MKRFIIKLSLIGAPVLIIVFLLELGLRMIPSDYKLQKKYLDAHSNEIETLILGSSQTFCGIDPKYFRSNTYNAGYLVQTLELDFLIVDKYKDNFKNLKTIILPISYFSLFSNLSFTHEAWRIQKYDIYKDLNLFQRVTKFELSNQNLKVTFKRLSDYYIYKNNPLISDSLGWGISFKSERARDLNESGKKTAELHRFDMNREVVQIATEKNKELLEGFMQWSKEKNIKIILLTPPTYVTYRDNIHEGQWSLTLETANVISSDYNNSEYINLMSDSSFTAEDFYDANHLSEIGAEKLSKMLSSIIDDEIDTIG